MYWSRWSQNGDAKRRIDYGASTVGAGRKESKFEGKAVSNFFERKKKAERNSIKFQADHNWEVAKAGWTMRFQSVSQGEGGDGVNYYLWIGNKGKIYPVKFKFEL